MSSPFFLEKSVGQIKKKNIKKIDVSSQQRTNFYSLSFFPFWVTQLL